MSKGMAIAALAAALIIGVFLGGCIQGMTEEARAGQAERAKRIDPAGTYWGADESGNPIGKRAGGRFSYVQYDDAMEVLKDETTGREYLVWYWRDDLAVVPLGTAGEGEADG